MLPNYERPPFSPQPKHDTPRVIEKKVKRTQKLSEEKRIKALVRKRDKVCRVCLFRRAAEVHEFRFKSLMGPVSLENSGGVCAAANGGLCHQLLQTNAIKYEFLTAAGAGGPMRFEMNASTARAVFGRHVVPKHVAVTT